MRPALSILFFTTLSGAGYGIWFLLGFVIAIDAPVARHDGTVYAALACGLVLTTAGLLFSVAHLGKPQRAWRAFSQWRSSWLSREGVAAVGCALIALALAACVHFETTSGIRRALGLGLLAAAVVVVFCTARIYSSLPTIAAWHNRWVLPVFLAFALHTGLLWWWLIATVSGIDGVSGPTVTIAFLLAAAATAAIKLSYWRHIDHAPATASTGSATGLDRLGSVRSAEHPHTEANYLTREMAFVLARKHARKLRLLVLVAGFVVPMALAVIALMAPSITMAAAVIAMPSAMLAALAERWLFFAEARHVVALYYGARHA